MCYHLNLYIGAEFKKNKELFSSQITILIDFRFMTSFLQFKRSNLSAISKLIDQKTMVHLHHGILCSIKKEETPALCNSMDGTGEHYAK